MVNKSNSSLKIICLLATIGIFVADQTGKIYATNSVQFAGDHQVICGLMDFVYARNTGIAFSLLIGHGEIGRYCLSIVALAAATAVIFFGWRAPTNRPWLVASLASLLGGIVGNVTDRIRLGYVVDFIQIHYKEYYFPVFNIADIAVCVGAALLLIDMFVSNRNDPKVYEAQKNL